jgi:hypothetical protein
MNELEKTLIDLKEIINNYFVRKLTVIDANEKVSKIADLIGKQRGVFLIYKMGTLPSDIEFNAFCLIDSWQVFSRKGIPFELWDDIAEEGLVLLKKLLEDPSVPFKELPGFEEFDDRVVKRARAIRNLDNEEINYVMSEMECVVSSKFSQEQLEKWARQVKEIS